MQTLKNKILIKLIFIISILMIVALNLFGEIEESIEFNYYYYTNKIYHSTLKTEIIPSDYVFINTSSNEGRYKNIHSYIYNLKTKEKKLFYIDKGYSDYKGNYDYEYYDINGNLTTNWTDENMRANSFYKITNNRFGETFYNRIDDYDYSSRDDKETIEITKGNYYLQKAYKYSLTQPETINKKDRGIYLFKTITEYYHNYIVNYIVSFLCFQNEYYKNDDFRERDLLNYTNGRVIVHKYNMLMQHSYSSYDGWRKQWITYNGGGGNYVTNIIYFQLNNKSLIKPTWNDFTNDYLNYRKSKQKGDKVYYTKEDIENNLYTYNAIMDTKYLGFIPIEEFEYYLLAD